MNIYHMIHILYRCVHTVDIIIYYVVYDNFEQPQSVCQPTIDATVCELVVRVVFVIHWLM